MLATHARIGSPLTRFHAARPALVWTFAPHLDWFGRIVPLPDGDLVIGRSGGDLSVDDRGASRLHARISREPSGGWTVTDLGSTNGTFLNGVRVRSADLQDGDEIRIGAATAFRFSTGADAPVASVLAA
jgi:hypothetical protein